MFVANVIVMLIFIFVINKFYCVNLDLIVVVLLIHTNIMMICINMCYLVSRDTVKSKSALLHIKMVMVIICIITVVDVA